MNYLLKFKIKHWNNSTSLLCGLNFLSVFFFQNFVCRSSQKTRICLEIGDISVIRLRKHMTKCQRKFHPHEPN